MRPLCLQPLKVVDPDHPLAVLVRKAQADSPAPTPPTAGGTTQPSQVEYTADCEYLAVRLPACRAYPAGRHHRDACSAHPVEGLGGLSPLGSSRLAVLGIGLILLCVP